MMTVPYEKTMQETIEFQSNILKGVKALMNMPRNEIKSDLLDKDEVLSIGKMKLYHYKPVPSKAKKVSVPLMITYALVNKQYMMDIQPDRSVIKAFLEAGLDVYIIDWGYPTAEDKFMTMDDHINWYMDACVDYIRKTTGHDKINLLGVCQGGTFSTIYTALHQDKVNALVTMVTPIDFSPNDALLFAWSKSMDGDALVDAYGVVPGRHERGLPAAQALLAEPRQIHRPCHQQADRRSGVPHELPPHGKMDLRLSGTGGRNPSSVHQRPVQGQQADQGRT